MTFNFVFTYFHNFKISSICGKRICYAQLTWAWRKNLNYKVCGRWVTKRENIFCVQQIMIFIVFFHIMEWNDMIIIILISMWQVGSQERRSKWSNWGLAEVVHYVNQYPRILIHMYIFLSLINKFTKDIISNWGLAKVVHYVSQYGRILLHIYFYH